MCRQRSLEKLDIMFGTAIVGQSTYSCRVHFNVMVWSAVMLPPCKTFIGQAHVMAAVHGGLVSNGVLD